MYPAHLANVLFSLSVYRLEVGALFSVKLIYEPLDPVCESQGKALKDKWDRWVSVFTTMGMGSSSRYHTENVISALQ